MQLFYTNTLQEGDTVYSFDKEESKHIVKVLRKKEGDILFVTNGLGFLFETEIILATEKKCTVSILSQEQKERDTYHIHLAVAPTKMNERYEWFLEKATEIGIHEITPIICDHSERKVLKTERFEKILQSAMKQSNQYYLPKLNAPVSFKDFMNTKQQGNLYIAHCEETNKTELKDCITVKENYILLIGPEGDFSTKEIETALQNGYQPVSLGNTRLRTETAGIVACHTFVLANN